jgi:hypothetical protein
MRVRKTLIILIGLITCCTIKAQEVNTLPFLDDFEETIGNDAIFQNWNTENIQGWQYWHLIQGGGNGGQCMRFEICDLDQNDWLITKAIDCSNTTQLAINFDIFNSGSGLKPRLFYASAYNGNAAESDWAELSYSLGTNINEWHRVDEIVIDSPGDVIYLAFQYQAGANQGIYCLLDNFSVKEYIAPPTYELVGSSDHFEFYTNIENQALYFEEISDALERGYLNYQSLWVRPGFKPIYPDDHKISVILTQREQLLQIDTNLPDWDCGIYKLSSGEIYICPLKTEDQQNYYHNFSSLAVNELAQLALAGLLGAEPEEYFREGFGLYEMGYRPNRDDLLQKLSDIGTNVPTVDQVRDITKLYLPGNKDLLASLFESKALLHCYYYISQQSDYKWWQLLKHYYIKDEDRIQQIYSSDHFDIYGADKEFPYAEDLALNMEEQLSLQENRFEKHINHRLNICIYDDEVGKEINNRTDFQGLACGADKINSTHQEKGHYGLLNHEFMHAWVNMLSNHNPGPGQFLNEGLAESTDAFMTDEEMPFHRYKIDDLFYHYQRKYNREPTWLEIVDNAEVNKDDGFWVDSYALGEMYWRYMNDKYPENFWVNVKLFLQNGRDWSVFGGKSAEQEGAEFMQFMKELAFAGPPLETTSIPFHEDFKNEFSGWTRMRFGGNDQWQIADYTGYDDALCAVAVNPYWFDENEDKTINSWLVSPPLDAAGMDKLRVQFMYNQTGNADKPEIYYTDNFSGPTTNANWIKVENLEWNAPQGTWGQMEFEIIDPSSKLYIALRFQSKDGDDYQYFIDNFEVKEAVPEPLAVLPFSDDFSKDYENWIAVSDVGDDAWHISGDDGIDGGKCARFYKISNPGQQNDDWLISPVFNTTGISNMAITFKYLYAIEGVAPDFYYSSTFDGDPAGQNWTKINKDFWINSQGWNDARIEIENPEESFVFAVRYKAMSDDEYYFLMDNFSIEAYEPVVYNQAGSSEHFEFYVVTPADAQYWNEIKILIEDWYAELCSYWDRPGRESVYESDVPVKIYVTSQQGVDDAIGIDFPEWKYGGYKIPNELYLAVPPENDPVYNGSFTEVTKNVLSQLMLMKRFMLEGNNYLPSYFSEAFGQYYCGYRPDKAAILKAISDYGGYPKLADIKSTEGFDTTYRKDILVSYVEAQALSRIGIQNIASDGYERLWQRHFKYFYELNDDYCIQLRDQTEHFDLYFSEQDRPYMRQIASKLEEKYSHYSSVFGLDIKHKFNVIIYPSEEAGMYCLVFSDNYNGGSAWSGDVLDFLSPEKFGGGIDEALRSLIPHEFFHAFHFNFVTHLFEVAPFNSEGMAELMAYEGENEAYLDNYGWYFEDGFNRFKKENGREPKLADIMPDKDSYMSVYTYGHAFWYFMIQNYTDYITIKEFFEKGEDWSVFDVSYETIDSAYIAYLKSFFKKPNSSSDITSSINSFKIYPNPSETESVIVFSNENSGHINLSIFDFQGRKIITILDKRLMSGDYSFPISNYIKRKGIYFCRLSTENGTSTIKIIID